MFDTGMFCFRLVLCLIQECSVLDWFIFNTGMFYFRLVLCLIQECSVLDWFIFNTGMFYFRLVLCFQISLKARRQTRSVHT